MSVHLIYYEGAKKKMRPIQSREEYMKLRHSTRQQKIMKAVHEGDEELKRKLVQMNYSCLPNDDSSLKGSTRMSTTIGMDVDHIPTGEMEATKQRILEKKDELGLLMLEVSARGEGYHLVFRRREELTQEENLKWASDLLGVKYDEGAKDITRVFYTTTGEELVFLEDEIFQAQASPQPSPKGKGEGTASPDPSKGKGEENAKASPQTSDLSPQPSALSHHTYLGPVILATGHSARDVYRYLADARVEIESKGIAVGVRLEHPAELIDQIQYHSRQGRGKYLPAAEYSFVTQVDGRGVYSFCMCPGGFVIPAATDQEQIVVNGMSPSNRGGRWSNSGMVVEVRPEDLPGIGIEAPGVKGEEPSPLAMMHFQEQLERDCWQQGNRRQTAPAQRMADFVNKRLSYDLPQSSYAPGLISSPLHFWMPQFISHRLQEGFKAFGRQSHGFLTNEAVMIGVETRTSSPVRIVRNPETLMHVRLEGLFPCGEGAGYAGGIVSAGVDGERCAEMCAKYMDMNRDC